MKYQLIDVEQEVEENVEFGTCDLCSRMGTLSYDVLVFKDENGYIYKVDNGEWSWGDWLEHWFIDNYIKFADFIKDREYPEPDYYDDDDMMDFSDIVHEMYNDYQEKDC